MAENPAPIDPIRAALAELEQRRKRRSRRILYNAGPVAYLQAHTAGNDAQQENQA